MCVEHVRVGSESRKRYKEPENPFGYNIENHIWLEKLEQEAVRVKWSGGGRHLG